MSTFFFFLFFLCLLSFFSHVSADRSFEVECRSLDPGRTHGPHRVVQGHSYGTGLSGHQILISARWDPSKSDRNLSFLGSHEYTCLL